MLNYIGNFKYWISDRWVDEVINKDGIAKPSKGHIPRVVLQITELL